MQRRKEKWWASCGGGEEECPPPGLEGEDLARWWRRKGCNLNSIEVTSGPERICPYCDSVQPCSGVDECTSCGHSLKGAKRVRLGLFQQQL